MRASQGFGKEPPPRPGKDVCFKGCLVWFWEGFLWLFTGSIGLGVLFSLGFCLG